MSTAPAWMALDDLEVGALGSSGNPNRVEADSPKARLLQPKPHAPGAGGGASDLRVGLRDRSEGEDALAAWRKYRGQG